MHDSALVQVHDGLQQLAQDGTGIPLTQRPARDDVIEQLAATHELHDDVDAVSVLEHVEEPDDVRVLHLAQQLDLAQQLRHQVCIVHGQLALVQDLDGVLGPVTGGKSDKAAQAAVMAPRVACP